MASITNVEFGRRVRAARGYGYAETTKPITQGELAEALGLRDYNIVRGWETGASPPINVMRRGIGDALAEMTGLPREFFEVQTFQIVAVADHEAIDAIAQDITNLRR